MKMATTVRTIHFADFGFLEAVFHTQDHTGLYLDEETRSSAWLEGVADDAH